MTKSLAKLAFAGILTVLSLGQAAKADLTPIFQSAVASGSNTVFTYAVSLSTGSLLVGGGVNDYVTMYDFRGYIPGSATVISSLGTWVPSEQAFGVTPASIAPVDTALTNITFTFTSAGQIIGNGQTVVTFSLTSTLPLATGGQFTQYAGSSTNASNSTVQGNIGFIQGPNLSVPEPSTFALLGVGGVLCTMYARRIRRDRTA